MSNIKKKNLFQRIWLFLAVLGPGLITASADNDAPGIATYSMAGSFYGYRFLWLILVITFGEVIIQEMAARMGAVTGKGTADLIRERYGVKITFFAMICLLIANLGTTIAQFAGIAAGGELIGINRYIFIPIISILLIFMALKGNYKYMEKVLLVLCLAALSYVITAIMIKPDIKDILKNTFEPSFTFNRQYLLAMLATIGTTITPWGIFYMQASVVDKGVTVEDYPLTRADVMFGSVWGNLISAFIIICTAATLYSSGVRVEEAGQAALALAPLAGEWATILFAIGLLGASILASTVLPLSTVYAITEAFGWERGLDQRREDAPVFYGLFIGLILVSSLFVMIPGLPLFQIMWLSQSVNAILLPILLILLLKLANNKEIMGAYSNTKFQNYFAMALTVLIVVITFALFVLSAIP
ncbi:MAG: Nramp family divalent metal transporter [Anaerolineae bacterium]|nr:Nramp family divalent metal transporter [Anaerolineae bacterium]